MSYPEPEQDRDYREAARDRGCTCPDGLGAHTHRPDCPLAILDQRAVQLEAYFRKVAGEAQWKRWETQADVERDLEDPQHTARIFGAVMLTVFIATAVAIGWMVVHFG